MAKTESALVVLVPEADPLVGPFRSFFDPSAALGVPAHVTLLYPFVEPAEDRREDHRGACRMLRALRAVRLRVDRAQAVAA